jgi:Tol biopolymer transport system component
MLKGITIRVSVPDRSMPERQANGVPSNTGNQGADVYSISRDGKRVVFNASASNLVANDNNRATDVFVRDIPSGTTERVSLSSSGAEANGDSRSVMGFGLHTVSDDGRYVVFNSDATNLVNRTTDGKENVYRRDRWLGTTTLMTVSSTDAAANNSVGPGDYRQTIYTEVAPIIMAGGLTVGLSPLSYSMTADGRYVVFNSDATNLVPGDTNTATDIFLHDAANGSTARVSVSSDGAQAEGGSCDSPTISADGSFVAFHSTATNLVINDTNQSADVFVREMPRPNPMTGWY